MKNLQLASLIEWWIEVAIILLLFSGVASAVEIAYGPYLSNLTQNSVVVNWITDVPCSSYVEYGTDEALGFSARDTALVCVHHLRLIRLLPFTRYYYRVHYPEDESDIFSFKTMPTGSTPFSFMAFGDTRTDRFNRSRVAMQMETEEDAIFVLHTGDIVEDGGDSSLWQNYFEDYCDVSHLACNHPIFYALGNHEHHGSYYFDYFDQPHNNPDSTETYYSFDAGSRVHFIRLSTEDDYSEGSPQYVWLDNDLAASEGRYDHTIVFFHRPPYSANLGHGSEMDVRETICPLMEGRGVDLVFNGHNHWYERSIPINGITYIVAAGGGAPLSPIFNPFEWFLLTYEINFHYVVCRYMLDASMHCEAISVSGDLIDSFSVSSALKATDAVPEQFEMNAYPNPFNSSVIISVGALPANIEIFDLLGNCIWNRTIPRSAPVEMVWTPEKTVPSGIYLVRATVDEKSLSKRIVYLK